jgi:hypothetical protein
MMMYVNKRWIIIASYVIIVIVLLENQIVALEYI